MSSCVCARLLDDAKPSALISHVDSASLVSNTLALCEQRLSSMPIFWSGHFGMSYMHWFTYCFYFFPRASERRVLPIVGVCKTSSHLHIFSSSHLLLIFSSSHLLIFTSSHLHIFTSSHPHIFSSSHLLLIFSSSPHLLIFSSSSHLHIFFTSSHPHIFSSSSHLLLICSSSPHLLIFTSSHLHIFSHLLIFTSSHLHIFSHLLTSSHIFSYLLTSSHIFSSSHLLISHLLLLPSCPLLLFYFSFEGGSRGSANETARNTTLSHEMRFDRQKLR